MDNSVKCKGDGTTSLWRRYSEFELLRNYLDIMHPALVIPPLPEKKVIANLSFTYIINFDHVF